MSKYVKCRTCGEMVKYKDKGSHWASRHEQDDFDRMTRETNDWNNNNTSSTNVSWWLNYFGSHGMA